MIQDIGYKDIEIINFRLVNITCGMGLDFIMDVKQYNKSRKDTLRTKNDFAGSRHLKLASTLVSGASVTVFKEKSISWELLAKEMSVLIWPAFMRPTSHLRRFRKNLLRTRSLKS